MSTIEGSFIVFEGGDGAGKSTQVTRLASHLDAIATREPGATALGRDLRSLLLSPDRTISDRTEALLMSADRAQHMAEVVVPALAAGRCVVGDRSAYSTLAYQGFGRGLELDHLRTLCDWACAGRWPDLVVLLDVPVDVGSNRVGGDPDRMEQAGRDFHRRVIDGYRQLAASEPERFHVVDARRPIDEISAEVRSTVSDRLGRA